MLLCGGETRCFVRMAKKEVVATWALWAWMKDELKLHHAEDIVKCWVMGVLNVLRHNTFKVIWPAGHMDDWRKTNILECFSSKCMMADSGQADACLCRKCGWMWNVLGIVALYSLIETTLLKRSWKEYGWI